MKKQMNANGPSLSEELIQAFPEVYREYQALEGAFSTPGSMVSITRKNESKMQARFNELFAFFQFTVSRGKYKTNFWEGKFIND